MGRATQHRWGTVVWQMKTEDARRKLRRLYPSRTSRQGTRLLQKGDLWCNCPIARFAWVPTFMHQPTSEVMASRDIDVDVWPEAGRVWVELEGEGRVAWDHIYRYGDGPLREHIDFRDSRPHRVELPHPEALIGSIHMAWSRFALVGNEEGSASLKLIWKQEKDGEEIVLKEHEQSVALTPDASTSHIRDAIYFWIHPDALIGLAASNSGMVSDSNA